MPVDVEEEVAELVVEEVAELVLLENEKSAREGLAEALERRGLKVWQAESGLVAISLADSTQARVFLMDIKMEEGEIDGIDAARRIQVDYPFSSFIFITGFSEDLNYRQRVEEAGLRVGGWIEKPVREERLSHLVVMARKEINKVRMREFIAQARVHGVHPQDYLRSIPSSDTWISHVSVEELIEELGAQEDDPRSRLEKKAMERDAEIERLYDEIRTLASRSASDPSLKTQIDRLKARLRALQEEEAAEVERQFNARLHLEPGSGWRALEQAKRLAGK